LNNSGQHKSPGLSDVFQGLSRWRTWSLLGYYDFIGSYRKTTLGPIWQIVHVAAWILGLWLVFGENRNGNSLLYIAAGVVCWSLLQGTLVHMPRVFQSNSGLIESIPNPLSLHVFRQMSEQALRWLVQVPFIIALAFFYDVTWGLQTLLVLLGVGLDIVILAGGSLFLSVVGARLPDLRFAVDAVLRLAFFMTPIFWTPGGDPLRSALALYNPFSYMINMIRQPLMGETPELYVYGIATLLALASVTAGLAAFSLFRDKVLYWI
jgi:ABC-type polysaccharide/polyol phosphate export permease